MLMLLWPHRYGAPIFPIPKWITVANERCLLPAVTAERFLVPSVTNESVQAGV